MLSVGSIIDVEIKNLASSGKGVGFVDADTTRAVFVDYSVPGDLLEVVITKQKKVYFEAKILKIKKPSTNRRKPVCSHFTICGACDFLHIKYDEQIKQKQVILEFFAKKHGLDLNELDIIPAKKEYHYRDKVKTQGLGFFKKGSNEVVPIKKCFIINNEFNKIVFKDPPRKFIYDYKNFKVTTKKGYYYFDGLEIKHHPNGFVQSNIAMNEELIKKVIENVVGKKVLELYCGNGNFTLPLIKKGFEVTAIEGDRLGFELLNENLERNNLDCERYNLDVKNHIYDNKYYDTVILDPPRIGSLDLLNTVDAKRIVYVSCNPNIALKEIKKSDFKIKKTILIDMFPNTKHLEVIFILEK
ncbi:MAG: class I SAM-dependent RNA methyltransferase [Candidatus Woesearchaeota archaeon]